MSTIFLFDLDDTLVEGPMPKPLPAVSVCEKNKKERSCFKTEIARLENPSRSPPCLV